MSITKEQIIEEISNMSVIEINNLISMIEKKFEISSLYIKEDLNKDLEKNKDKIEKTEFNIILKDIGNNKISVIKSIRSIMNLGLKESKDLVESFPVLLKEKITKSEVENIKKKLEESGAIVEII